MSSGSPNVPVFSPPSPFEVKALELSAAYLKRAGNEAASRLLDAPGLNRGKIDLISTLRNEMHDSAALCECLIAMFDSWDVELPSQDESG